MVLSSPERVQPAPQKGSRDLLGGRRVHRDGLGSRRRGELRKRQRVDQEDRTENRRHLNENIARIGTEGSFHRTAAERTAKTAFFRLLKHHDQAQHQAHEHFDNVQETNQDVHLFFYLS